MGIPKKVDLLNRKFHGRRPVGRPRLRWEDNIRRDAAKYRGWRKLARRDIWRRTVEAARARCGLS
jgi:hypothetical protein